MARARTQTLLSLDGFARELGINPLHFNGGVTPSLDVPVFEGGGCSDIWPQHAWQDADRVSREHLARKIHNAEIEIANLVGFFPAPIWIEQEVHNYPRPYPREGYGNGTNVRGSVKGIKTDYGKYISGGRRNFIEVGEATVAGLELAYTDDDGDDFYETATITLEIPAGVPASPEACNFKVFFDGQADPEWEIRYPNTFEIVGDDIVLTFDSWLFIDPDEQEGYPTAEGFSGIDVSTINNFVDTVDVYYVYNDMAQASAQFIWESGSSLSCDICGGLGCEACAMVTQDGCVQASMMEDGIVRPTPGTYDEDDEIWDITSFTENVEPDMVKLWYYSGEQSQEFVKGRTCDPLSRFWADLIAVLVCSRLKRNLCDCPSIKNTVEYWQKDLAKLETNVSYFQNDDIQNSPFGTTRGEVYAWKKIQHFVPKKKFGFAVI